MDLNDKKFTILLLTNRDSDNVGDQVIEASDIGLLHVLMKNLGIDKSLIMMQVPHRRKKITDDTMY